MNPDIEFLIKENLHHIRLKCKFVAGAEKQDDLLSAVLEKVWKHRNTFITSESGDFRKWVSVIIKNSSIDLFRRINFNILHDSEHRDIYFYPSRGMSIIDKIDHDHFLDTIKKDLKIKFVKDKYLDCFDLHFVQGFKLEQTSKELNLPLNTVKMIIKRIRDYLNLKYAESYRRTASRAFAV